MARSVEQILREQVGNLVLVNTQLQAENEALKEALQQFEEKKPEKEKK